MKPNWSEVLKLSASLFRLNQPTRVGRSKSSEFVRFIKNIKDDFHFMNRPLKMAISILSDGTEVDHALFNEIINEVLDNILCKESVDFEDEDREVMIFTHLLRMLLQGKLYQQYLLNIFEEKLFNSENSNVKKNIIKVLIPNSDIDQIRNKLIQIIESDNESLKEVLIKYNVVSPTYPIFKTIQFQNMIVQYINTDKYIESYQGSIPIQYCCSFLFEYFGLSADLQKTLKSIDLVKNKKMKHDYINFLVFSIGINVEDLTISLREKDKDLDLSLVEKYLNFKEEIEKYKPKFKIGNYNNIDIYKIENTHTCILVKDYTINIFNFFEEKQKIARFFSEDTDKFISFLSYFFGTIENADTFKEEQFEDVFILLYFEYHKSLHWDVNDKLQNSNSILNFALNNLFIDKYQTLIISWFNHHNFSSPFRNKFNIVNSFDKDLFKDKILSSSWDIHDKLFFMSHLFEKGEYSFLLKEAIDYINRNENKEKINKVKNELYLCI